MLMVYLESENGKFQYQKLNLTKILLNIFSIHVYSKELMNLSQSYNHEL